MEFSEHVISIDLISDEFFANSDKSDEVSQLLSRVRAAESQLISLIKYILGGL